MKFYLAGPDVFRLDAKGYGEELKKMVSNAGHSAIFPLDDELDDSEEIYQANMKMINKADGVIANITPFRGPSLDVGTAFEIGYAKALGKPIYTYGSTEDYRERAVRGGYVTDPDFPVVEDFGLVDNLMIVHSADAHFRNLHELLDYIEGIDA